MGYPNSIYLVRTMSDTVETDIGRVHVIANEVLARYGREPLSFEQLRKIADGPFDLFLIPIIFEKEYRKDGYAIFNEGRRQEIRNHALEIARRHRYDVDPPDLVPGIEESLRATESAGLVNILMTTGGRRFQHQAMERRGLGRYFKEIVDREQTYFTKEQGIYYLFRNHPHDRLRIVLLSGTSSYIRAGNNLESCAVAGKHLEVFTVAVATDHSYNDEETLRLAQPKTVIHQLDELLPRLGESGWLSESVDASKIV